MIKRGTYVIECIQRNIKPHLWTFVKCNDMFLTCYIYIYIHTCSFLLIFKFLYFVLVFRTTRWFDSHLPACLLVCLLNYLHSSLLACLHQLSTSFLSTWTNDDYHDDNDNGEDWWGMMEQWTVCSEYHHPQRDKNEHFEPDCSVWPRYVSSHATKTGHACVPNTYSQLESNQCSSGTVEPVPDILIAISIQHEIK